MLSFMSFFVIFFSLKKTLLIRNRTKRKGPAEQKKKAKMGSRAMSLYGLKHRLKERIKSKRYKIKSPRKCKIKHNYSYSTILNCCLNGYSNYLEIYISKLKVLTNKI